MANESKIEKSGLLEYHNAGLKGQGKTIVVLDETPYLWSTMDKNTFNAPYGFGKSASHASWVAQTAHYSAPKAKIVMLPFMTNADREWAIAWLRSHKGEYDFINMSLNLATADKFYPMLQELNVPIIASAGNGGWETKDVTLPARFDWAIAVGGYNEGTEMPYEDNNGGENMDCVAFTYVDVETKPNYWVSFSGTSCSAPWLCGMLATYYTNVDTPDVYAIRELIKSYSIDIYTKGKDRVSGYGFFKLPTLAERENLMAKTEIILELGKSTAKVNGEVVALDCAPFAQDGRTYVPLRFVAENLGCNVDYNKGKITISKN